MGEIFDHLRRVLGLFAGVLEYLSPWGIPWPLTFALVFPIILTVLAVMVWWSRGKMWPVLCEYPRTTTGRPCRNRVFGEWQRCHHHRPGNRGRNRREIRKLLRWQTIRRGDLVERDDIFGRGFLRHRTQVRGLLYYRGFARPPRNVATIWRSWLGERREDIGKLIAQLREQGRLNLRALFAGPASPSAQVGVAMRLTEVIWATRLTLLLALLGLILVAFGEWRNYPPKGPFGYLPSFLFIAAWAVARRGIWLEATAGPQRPGWRGSWPWEATGQAVRWFVSFLAISVLFGQLLDHLEKFPFSQR
ncbi:hypothetical protein [Nocardia sp. CS682]|uniref:hypothetical protein n=1 Tax=Nocardia sp. CS682 TaxID=1047172 RepID=UPI001074BE28|nr:hypothetical protein [Nocardia sp. CS682]QBS43107.1 hypothetical protein DMB37_26380 [Nocardia sp. CS682]